MPEFEIFDILITEATGNIGRELTRECLLRTSTSGPWFDLTKAQTPSPKGKGPRLLPGL